jgi:hypothetical protein
VSPSGRAAVKWWHGWLPLVSLPTAVLLLWPFTWPRWMMMWSLAFAIYCGCKWLTWRRTPVHGVPAWRHLAYLVAWPGLDAAAFLQGGAACRPRRAEWARAWRNLAVGIALFFGIARFVAPLSLRVAGWLGMAGVVLALHFGSFHLLSCAWRRANIEARPLMNSPLAAESLAEFWGRRWNTAFRDLTHRFLFRPMTRRFGVPAGIAGGFVFSGFVHELVVSIPADGGYGGPTAFFAAQGIGILVERTRFARQIGLASGARGWLFAMVLLVAPAPWLFHAPFIERIVAPFMQSMGAL